MRLINGQYQKLQLSKLAQAHFDEPKNYTAFILDEWEALPYKEYLKPGSIVLDIGANIGLFTLHVMPYCKRIICVEPTPGHMEILRELMPYSEHEQAALNSYTGKARFRTEPINTTMNTLSNEADSYEVDCLTLADLCSKYNLSKVDFCKVDIEGSEWKALSTERIKEVSGIIKAFFVELHPRTEGKQIEMGARFLTAGYKVKYIDYNGSIYCYK